MGAIVDQAEWIGKEKCFPIARSASFDGWPAHQRGQPPHCFDHHVLSGRIEEADAAARVS